MALSTSTAMATPAPDWTIGVFAAPSVFSTADNARCVSELGNGSPRCDGYVVTATNVGGLAMDGSEVTIVDNLPTGLTARGIALFWSGYESNPQEDLSNHFGLCTTTPVRCVLPASFFATYGDVRPDDRFEMIVYVTVDEPRTATSLSDTVTVSGGGAGEASASEQGPIGSGPQPFGLVGLISYLVGVNGAPEAQAGGRPYELTTTLDLANAFRTEFTTLTHTTSTDDLKDVVVDLPVGFVGSTLATPMCKLAELASKLGCPPDTRVGHIFTEPQNLEGADSAIYNLVPERGTPAEFGFKDLLHGSHVMYASVAPSPSGYVLRVTTREIPQVPLTKVIVNFYGDPALRDGSGNTQVAMLTNPSDCSGEPLTTTAYLDSWQHPAAFNSEGMPDFNDSNWASASTTTPPVTGCNELRFHPTITLAPTTTAASSPTGLDVSLSIPQSTDPQTLATPPLKRSVVTLPVGVSLNPSSADKLTSCTLAQIGISATGEPNAAAPKCPEASKIGTVRLETPLLSTTLEGAVYLATQEENPFRSLIAFYIVVNDAATGTVIKLPGQVRLDPNTGQITTVFDDTPQLPFSKLTLRFNRGPRAPLVTPAYCGTYASTAELTPWSSPESGPPATLSDPFAITSTPGGAPCSAPGFAPLFMAGTSNNQAGAFTPFATDLSREDGEQTLSTVTLKMPEGVSGMVSAVTLCSDAQASIGECPADSKIGHVRVSVGAGADPMSLPEAGKPEDPVYLTGPYDGAPFGLAIVVPAEAGPFNLDENGRPVVVRARIEVDPHTAQVTAVSDPMPTRLQGVPFDVRRVEVVVDKPGFIFNPTNCDAMGVAGTIGSSEGASESVSSRFQAANCATLPFHPSFKASTQGATSRKSGASLDVKVGSTSGQANIAKVHVSLPKKLPSRLETLKLACLAAVFNSNPAACPEGSRVGEATAITPVLAHPLTGPAYLVSHGGAAFPDVEIVLQGENVTLVLDGQTDIKNGITTSTFNSVPDVPVSSFELNLPEGPYSVLGGPFGNLCGKRLLMPTTITGQNGAVIKQSTNVAITGCKPAVRVLSHHVKGHTVKIVASVPSAGKLVVSGTYLTSAVRKRTKAGDATVTLTLTKAGRAFLARHRGRRLRASVRLRFTPTRGHVLTTNATVLVG